MGRRRARPRSLVRGAPFRSSRSRASRRRESSRSTCSRRSRFEAASTRPRRSAIWRAGCLPSPSREPAGGSPSRTPTGALPPLPMGSDRPAAGLALRGRARRIRVVARAGGVRAGGRARPAHHGDVRGLARRQAGYARAQRAAHRRLRARRGHGSPRGGDQRGGRPREAVRVGGGRAAGQRHPRAGSRARRRPHDHCGRTRSPARRSCSRS